MVDQKLISQGVLQTDVILFLSDSTNKVFFSIRFRGMAIKTARKFQLVFYFLFELTSNTSVLF